MCALYGVYTALARCGYGVREQCDDRTKGRQHAGRQMDQASQRSGANRQARSAPCAAKAHPCWVVPSHLVGAVSRQGQGLMGWWMAYVSNLSFDVELGRRFAAALLPRLFGTNPRSHHKGATGRVRTGDQRLPVLCHCQLGQDIPKTSSCEIHRNYHFTRKKYYSAIYYTLRKPALLLRQLRQVM